MFPSYGGTGYLRSSTRRRKTREELIAEQQARNQAMLGMPPGSAWDRVGTDIDPRMRASSRSPVVQLRGRPLPPEPVTQLSTPMAFPPLEEGFVPEQPNYQAVMPPTLPDFSTMLPSSVKRAEARPALSSSIPGALESGQAADAPEQSSFFGNMFKQDENGSNPLSLALLSAGLGILANNYGHYGQAGPAIGKGALQGLQTYLGERERSDRLTREKKEAQRAQAREEAYLRQVSAQEMRARNEDAADTRMQARRRLLLEMPEGPQRDRLLEMDMVESGQYPQFLKAGQLNTGSYAGTEAERQMAKLTAYMQKKNAGIPISEIEEMEYQNALALLQRPKTYVDSQTGRVFQQSAINVPEYAVSSNRGIKEVPIPRGEGRKSLDQNDQEWLRSAAAEGRSLNGLIADFKPNYGGMVWGPAADAMLKAGRSLPREIVGNFKDEAQWWMRYYGWSNTKRLAQTGLTLTKAEEEAFTRATAVPSDSPDVVAASLAKQQSILEDALARELTGLAADGRNMEAAESFAGLQPYWREGQPMPSSAKQPSAVKGVEEEKRRQRKKYLREGR